MSAVREEGVLDDGTAWRALVPRAWNGVLVSDADLTDLPAHADFDAWCLAEGIAVLRTSRVPAGWELDRALADRGAVHEAFRSRVADPDVVIATGESLGGMITRGVAERAPDLADAAVAMNGGGSGLIGLWNAKRDAGFALRRLVEDHAGLELPDLLDRAEEDAASRARATLAAAFAMQPVWSDPDAPRPAPDDLEAQARVMRSALGFGLAPGILAEVEALAGGVFAGNEDVDYRALGARLGKRRAVVEDAYERAGLSLDADLRALDDADRTRADAEAVLWAERASWTGRPVIPLVTVYAIGDPAAVPEEQRAYRDAALRGGGVDRLEEHFLDAAGHCRFTTGERAVGVLRALRLVGAAAGGPADDPQETAAAVDADRAAAGAPAGRAPAFTAHSPEPYLRPHDLADRPTPESGGV